MPAHRHTQPTGLPPRIQPRVAIGQHGRAVPESTHPPEYHAVISIKRPVLAIIAAAGCLLAARGLAPAAPISTEPSVLKKLVDDKAPAMVSIKFIMKGEQREAEEETTGVVIEPTGLVLTSN